MSKDQERAESLLQRLQKRPKKGDPNETIAGGCVPGKRSLKEPYPLGSGKKKKGGRKS